MPLASPAVMPMPPNTPAPTEPPKKVLKTLPPKPMTPLKKSEKMRVSWVLNDSEPHLVLTAEDRAGAEASTELAGCGVDVVAEGADAARKGAEQRRSDEWDKGIQL